MALLLVGAAVIRREGFQFVQCNLRLLEPTQVAATDRTHVKRIPVVGIGLQYGIEVAERINKALADDLLLDGCQVS